MRDLKRLFEILENHIRVFKTWSESKAFKSGEMKTLQKDINSTLDEIIKHKES